MFRALEDGRPKTLLEVDRTLHDAGLETKHQRQPGYFKKLAEAALWEQDRNTYIRALRAFPELALLPGEYQEFLRGVSDWHFNGIAPKADLTARAYPEMFDFPQLFHLTHAVLCESACNYEQAVAAYRRALASVSANDENVPALRQRLQLLTVRGRTFAKGDNT